MPRHHITLGFSCQSRFSIDLFTARHQRHPFDFVIASKAAVLEGLRTEGASFRHDAETIRLFTAAAEARTGVERGGIHFWHDYPLENKKTLVPDWAAHIPSVNAKYAALWPRFIALLRDEDAEVTLVICDTQWDLEEYVAAGSGFETMFGFDAAYHGALRQALDGLGARRCDILFTGRDLRRVTQLRAEIKDPRFRCRFGGVLKLRANSLLSVSAMSARAEGSAALDRLCGDYDDGVSITRSSAETALVRRLAPDGESALIAECSLLPDGYLVVLPGANNVFGAVLEGGALRIANGMMWRRRV